MCKEPLNFELYCPFSLIILILCLLFKNIYQPTSPEGGLKCHQYVIYHLKYILAFLVTVIKEHRRWQMPEGILFPTNYLIKQKKEVVLPLLTWNWDHIFTF